EAFGMTLGYYEKNPDFTFMHAELKKNGQEIFAVIESGNEAFVEAMLTSGSVRPTMSYGIDLDSEEEVRKAYSMLIEGGNILRSIGPLPWSPCSADVIDKYGVYWYIYLAA
ncbi:MAG: VOC family protein, partial [Gorillibacterium sp.]|nr:VOC family protein [Gorillibacterium sp.]